MSDFDLIYCRPSRSHKAKRIFELSYSQNDYLALRLQKGLTFQEIRQNYRWLEATNEVTKKRGFVSVDAIEPVENYAQVMNPPPPAAQETQALVRKVSVPQRLSEFNLEEDTYVQFFGCDALERGTNALPTGHNLVNVFFLTPILCIHCRDYIWGRGRQGVSCSDFNSKW